ncbi:MAG: hypothetical protein ABR992_11340 [Solirubrobacteraceae bacterium]|jgi:hypothetical protein
MQTCSKPIVVRLAPSECQHLAELAALRDQSLSDLVRELLRLPPESEAQTNQFSPTRHLRLVGGGR